MKEFKIYASGQFITSGNELPVTNPYTGEAFAQTWKADKQILENAIAAAETIREEMANLPTYEKYNALAYLSKMMKRNRQELAELLAMESGKPIRYALGEIDRASQTFLTAAEEAKRLPGEVISLDWTEPGKGREGIVKYFPVGLVAGIAPFNFPMNLAVHKIAPAIAAGCPIILKPASSTPLSTLRLAQFIDETNLPKGAISILPMDRETGNQLVTDERFSLLTFTGSPDVGWKMKAQAGKKKVVLELGGNAGVLIGESADLEHAITRSMIGGFAYSGQVCIHAQRFFVHERHFETFAAQMVDKAQQLKQGNPLDESTEISSMIDQGNAERVDAWVKEAVNNGAEILAGGKHDGTFYEPTILTHTSRDMKVCTEEIFGPVITIEKVGSFEEGIVALNDTKFGLQAGVFTHEQREVNQAFNQLKVGGVILNDVPTFRVDHMPYGGIKDSGLGREGLKYAIHDMLEPRILVKGVM